MAALAGEASQDLKASDFKTTDIECVSMPDVKDGEGVTGGRRNRVACKFDSIANEPIVHSPHWSDRCEVHARAGIRRDRGAARIYAGTSLRLAGRRWRS